MFTGSLRRVGTQSLQRRTFFSRQTGERLQDWGEQLIPKHPNDPDPRFVQVIKKEKFATALIMATTAYIAYAYNRPLKDTKLFDRRGDIRLPIITPFLDYMVDRFGKNTLIVPNADPFEHFTEEEKLKRVDYLDAQGFFDRYYQDQGDIVDKLRLMNSITQRALVLRDANATQFPEDEVYTLDQVLDLVHQQHSSKQPLLQYQCGDDIVTFETKMDRYASSVISLLDESDMSSNLPTISAQDTAAFDHLYKV